MRIDAHKMRIGKKICMPIPTFDREGNYITILFFLFSLVSLKQIIENISAKSGFIFKKLSGNLPVGIQKWVKQIKEYKKKQFYLQNKVQSLWDILEIFMWAS